MPVKQEEEEEGEMGMTFLLIIAGASKQHKRMLQVFHGNIKALGYF